MAVRVNEHGVVLGFETDRIATKQDTAEVYYARLPDGWVTAHFVTYDAPKGGKTGVGAGGGGGYPSVYGPRYVTKQEALAATWAEVRRNFHRPQILKLIDAEMARLGPVQLSLFNQPPCTRPTS